MRKGRGEDLFNVIPAKAGIHSSADCAIHQWIPAFAGITIFDCCRLCETSAISALKRSLLLLFMLAFAVPAQAACTGVVAGDRTRLWQAAGGNDKAVAISFLGHASFLIESPQGVTIVTDYNGMIRAPLAPDIVTMNNAHPTHYTDDVEPAVKYVLRGWNPAGGSAVHNLEYRDVKIHNVATNRRDFGATQYNANSIFVFDVADLCIAHLGHLHHTL